MQLHHLQWYAWRDRKDYAAILQPAPLLLNAHFVGMNANNASITVGLITEALAMTGSPALTVANTFLYGMYLLRNSRVSRDPEFCWRRAKEDSEPSDARPDASLSVLPPSNAWSVHARRSL